MRIIIVGKRSSFVDGDGISALAREHFYTARAYVSFEQTSSSSTQFFLFLW
jgi:hypothetical protein